MIFRTITDDITGANKSIGLFGKSLNDFKAIINSFKQNGIVSTLLNTSLINIDTDAINDYNNKIKSSTPYEQALAIARRTTNAETIALIESYHGAEVQIERVTAAQKASTIAAKAHSAAIKAVSITFNMLAFTFIVKGIQSLSKTIDQFVNRSKYTLEAMEKAQQSITDTQNSLRNISTTITENKDRFLELSEGVNRFSKNIKLSEEDYAEYLTISNKLAEIFPSLISGYTDQGDALLYIGNNAEDTNERLNRLLEAEKALAQQALIENMGDVANGIYYQVKSAEDQIATLQYQLNSASKNIASFEYLNSLIKDVDENTKMISFGVETGLAIEDIQKLKETIKNSGARIIDHPNFDSMAFFAGDYELVKDAIENFYAQLNYKERNEAAAYINGLRRDIQEQENTIREAYSKINSNLSAWAKGTYEYDFLDESQQNLIDALIPNLDWKSIKGETGAAFSSAAEYEQFVRQNIITPLMSIPDEYQDVLNQKFAQLLAFEADDIYMVDFVSELEKYLNDLGVTIDLTPLLGDSKELRECYEQITNDAAFKFIETSSKNYALLDAERMALDNFASQNSINTRAEIAFWNQCLEESATREEAMEKYLSSPSVQSDATPLSITETVEQIDTQLKSAFSSLQSAYQGIFTIDENTGEKRFTSLDEADITDKFKPILDALQDLDEIDGITVDYSAYEDFVSVLSDTSSTAEDVQEQFDRLATNIIYTSDCTKLSAETFNLLAESLSEMGVTNAYDVLSDILELQESLASEGINVEAAMSREAEALRNLTFASDEAAEHLFAYYIQKQLSENPISTLEDILQLENLCNALGVTGEMLQTITALKLAFEAKENGTHASGLEDTIRYNQQRLTELAAGYGNFAFNFDGTNTAASSGSSSSKSTVETFDWIEQAIENVEKEIKDLDEIANASYSTFSQKNEALAQEIQKVSDEIDLQQQAYDEYMRKAEAVALPDRYKQLIQNGAINIENISDENLQNLISEYQKWYEKAQAVSDAVKDLKTNMKDLYVSAYELQTGNLKDRLDSDSITQKQYLDGLKEAYEKFYADLEDFAEQYHEAVLEYLAEEKDYLNRVASAAASLIDTEIDKIQKDAESQEDLLQKQIDLLEDRKKPLQDELNALEDKAKKESLIYNLQKAQYELARSESQKTKLVYKDGQMVYTSDPETIRDARKDVEDAKLEIQKQSIQDRIDVLDDEIDRYNDLIDRINNAADTQIDALEKIQDKWQEVIDQQEYAKNLTLLTEEFGTGAITKILTGSDDDLLAQWKNRYIHTLADLDIESQGYISSMTGQIASLYHVDLSPLQSQFQNVTDSVSGITDALGKAASAIGSGISAPAYRQNAEGDPASSGSLSDSITNLGMISDETLPTVTSGMEDMKEAAVNASLEISNVAEAINSIPESKDVTISVHTVGGGSISGGISTKISQIAYGNVYASGTKHAQKGLAIVGEEKPEVIITNNKKLFLAEEPTLINMEGGETVFDGDATARMLKARGFIPITADESPLLEAFNTYSPDEIRQRFAPNLISPARTAASSAIQNASHAINNNSVNNNPSYTMSDVHIHCPGITKDEVAKQIGTELMNVFNGMSLKAYQHANVTR